MTSRGWGKPKPKTFWMLTEVLLTTSKNETVWQRLCSSVFCQLDWVHSGCLAFLLMLSDFAKSSFLKDLDSSSTSLLNKVNKSVWTQRRRSLIQWHLKTVYLKIGFWSKGTPKQEFLSTYKKKRVKVQMILKAIFSKHYLIFCLTCHGWMGIKNQLSIYVTYFCWMPSLH